MSATRAEIRRALQAQEPAAALDATVDSLIQRGIDQRALADALTAVFVATVANDPTYDILQAKMDEVWGGPWAKGRDLFPVPLRSNGPTPPLQGLLDGTLHRPDWSDARTRRAAPLLACLHYRVPEDLGPEPEALDTADLMRCCHRIVYGLRSEAGWSYSSQMVGRALEAVAEAAKSVPEPLLRAIWVQSAEDGLNRNRWYFMKTVGIANLCRYRDHPAWSLQWMAEPASDAQAALTFWTLGCQPSAIDEPRLAALERRIARLERSFTP